MAKKKQKKLIKEEKPESKETSYPDLGVGWKVRERWTWSNMRSKWQPHKEYISPSGKKFATLKSAQEHIDLIKELGPDWTVEEKWGRKVYHSPSGKEFRSLKQAKAHVATSNTQDVGEVEEKKNDTTEESSSSLVEIQKTYPPAFGSSSTSGDIDSVVDGDNGAKSKKGKQPTKRKRNDSDSGNCGSARSSSTSGSSMDIDESSKTKQKMKKKVKHQLKPVDDVDEERLRQENKLKCEEQQRAETEKQADKRRKEEDKLKREEDAKKRKIKGDKKRKRVEEEDEKRRIEAVSWH